MAQTPHIAMSSKASLALMKFLSDLSRRLGVGKHVYVVGGAVRNFVIDRPIKDIDVVIDSVALRGRDSDWFAKEVMKSIPAKVNYETNQYGVALLHIVGDWMLGGENLKGEDIEIANARTESYTDGGYTPSTVEKSTIEDDVRRREFTFNTLLWRLHDLANGPDKAEILDLSGCGLRDLEEGVMRCPSSPDKTFTDDPSRMIRAVKFLVKYGFKLSLEVTRSIKKNKAKVKNIPPSHLSNMLINTFLREPTGKKALVEMQKLGLLDEIKDIAQNNKAFRNALAGWADREAKVEFLFDLMDLGLPSGKRLSFLDRYQLDRVREITVGLSAAAADAFVRVLQQPGKVLDTRSLMQEFGLKGKAVRQTVDLARQHLLSDPALASNAQRLTQRVRQDLQRGKTAKQQMHVIQFDSGDRDITKHVPYASLPLLFNQAFADAVLASQETETVIPLEMLGEQYVEAAAKGNKKKVKTQKGEEVTIYEYGPRQIAERHREKAKKVEKLRQNLGALRAQVTRDLKNNDDTTRLCALAVGLMNDTYARVGNEESADSGHFGVTGWQAKHITFSDGKATITYVGKSGVRQKKTTSDAGLVSGLKQALEGKSDTDPVFDIEASDVNEYLKPHGITAKDIRGLHANREVQSRLKVIRSKGGKLPEDKKEREKKLKEEFTKALEEAATEVGHEASTLRNQYLVPGLEDAYLKDGTVMTKLDKQAALRGLLLRLIRKADEALAIFGWGEAQMDGVDDPNDLYGGGVLGYAWRKGRQWFSMAPGDRNPVQRDNKYDAVRGLRHPLKVAVEEGLQAVILATKSKGQKEEEEVERLQRRNPTKKPPRNDLRRNRMVPDDPDLKSGVEGDRDLSLNYKKVASLASDVIRALTADDKKKRRPGDVWKSDSGKWVAMNPKGNTHTFSTDSKGQDQAKAFAKGLAEKGEDTEKAVEEQKKREKWRKLKQQRKEFRNDAKALIESVDMPDDVRAEIESQIEKAGRNELARAYREAEKAMRESLKEGITAEMMRESKKDPFKDVDTSDPEQLAEAMVAAMVRDRLILDPSNVGGQPLSSVPLSEEDRVGRAEAAFKQFKHVSKEQRIAAGEKAARALADLEPDSPEAKELNAIIDGLHLACVVNDEPFEVDTSGFDQATQDQDSLEELQEKLKNAKGDEKKEIEDEIKILQKRIKRKDQSSNRGGLLREPLNDKLKTLAREMARQGNAKFLFLKDPTQMYEAEGREAVRDAMGQIDDATLVEMSQGTAWEPIANALDSMDLDPEVAEYLRATMRDMSVNQMTTVQGVASAIVKKKQDPKTCSSTYDDVAELLNDAMRDGMRDEVDKAIEKCLEAIDIVECFQKSDIDLQRRQMQAVSSYLDSLPPEQKPDPREVSVSLTRAIANGEDPSITDQNWGREKPIEERRREFLENMTDPKERERVRKMTPEQFAALEKTILSDEEGQQNAA